jgi:hypothetical protein
MSRKLILGLAAAATIATASLSSSDVYARGFGFGGGGFGGGHFASGGNFGGRTLAFRGPGLPGGGHTLHPILPPGGNPGHPGFPGHPGWIGHFGHYGHWVFRGGRWIILDGGDDVVVPVVATGPATVPGPCTCLTKTYTTDGLVVFADLCTQESASAPVAGKSTDATPMQPNAQAASAQQPAPPSPTNFAGRSYSDFLAANPQAAAPVAPKN